MPQGPFKPRHKMITVATIASRSGEVYWTMTDDEEGNKIPKRLRIMGIGVKPSISTIKAVRIYSKGSRISDAANANYSLVYEDTWSDFTLTSVNHNFVNPDQAYIDDDATDERLGSIYGTVQIKAGEANSAFKIDIYYIEN